MYNIKQLILLSKVLFLNALIIAAHGSRRALSNEEVVKLAEQLALAGNEHYQLIKAAFLELADPLIPEAIDECIKQGATKVVVLPYFLNSGRHAIEDIPQIVEQAQQQYPNVQLSVAPHLGTSPKMLELLSAAADEALAN